MAIAVRDEGKKVNSNINVTPMCDVMLVLLIIFMVITPMLQNKVNIDLAKVNNPTAMPDADKEDAVVVAVTRDSKVYLGQNQISMADLGNKVSDMLQNKTDKEIFMRADRRAQYGTVEDAIDSVRVAGVDQIGLLTERLQQSESVAKRPARQLRKTPFKPGEPARPARRAGRNEDQAMSMTTGGSGGLASDINITPLIDVMLVLLIIFMVIVPVTPNGLDALVPQPPKNQQQQQENDRTIVVQILQQGSGTPSYKINETDVAYKDLGNKLQGIFATRAEKVMFIKGDPNLNFAEVADVIDIGHAAGVDHIGLITPKVAAGQ